MSGYILISRIITILIILIIIMLLIREIKSLKYQKRIETFALVSIHDHEKSFFDSFLDKIWYFVHKLNKIFEKSSVLKKYGSTYEKHITFEEKEEKSGMDYISMKFLLAFLLMLFTLLTIIFQFTKVNPINFFFAFLIGFFAPDIVLSLKFKQKRKRIEDDLLKAIIIMNNSFKSGRNIMQAVEIVKNELDGPISDEFKKIYMDMTYGLEIDVVFNRFYERVKLEDAKYITSSLSLLNRTGGNIIRVFGSIEKSVFDKKKLQNEMKCLTAASVFVFRVLTVLPMIFTLLILLMNPTYFSPFFKTPYGFLIFLLIITLYVLYVITIKKVLKVKVE